MEKAHYPVTVLCRVLQVSRGGFYVWLGRPEAERVRRDQQLSVLVQASFEESRKTYGSPRVLRDLVDWGERVSRKRVARLMRESGLEARVRRRYKGTTVSDPDQPAAPNLLDRDFSAAGPNQRWVGDTTELLVVESWFSTLESELGERFESLAAAKHQLFDYIEVFYNQKRRHSTLGYVSPAEFERMAAAVEAAA